MDGVLQEYFTFRSHEPSLSLQCKWGVVVKAKGNKVESRGRAFFILLFMARRGCSLLLSSFNNWLRFTCVLWALTSFSVDNLPTPHSLAASSPSVLQEDLVSGHGETRHPWSKERKNYWGWILTWVGWAVTAEDDWSIESTLGHSGKLIHFLFTL